MVTLNWMGHNTSNWFCTIHAQSVTVIIAHQIPTIMVKG